MTAKLIKGNEIAEQIREELKREAAQFTEKYRLIPSPGGVGPMTVTMLMMNMLKAAKIAEGKQ